MLTPDLQYMVKRHVVAKRAIPVGLFPRLGESGKCEVKKTVPVEDITKNDDAAASAEVPVETQLTSATQRLPATQSTDLPGSGDGNASVDTFESLLDFSFRVQVR